MRQSFTVSAALALEGKEKIERRKTATEAASTAHMTGAPTSAPKRLSSMENPSLSPAMACSGSDVPSSSSAPRMRQVRKSPAEWLPGKMQAKYCTALGKTLMGM